MRSISTLSSYAAYSNRVTFLAGTDQSAIHANNINDLGGCALAIAYESDATQVQPEDFTVFSVNQTCVWEKDTVFQVPADMPPCPNGKCTVSHAT